MEEQFQQHYVLAGPVLVLKLQLRKAACFLSCILVVIVCLSFHLWEVTYSQVEYKGLFGVSLGGIVERTVLIRMRMWTSMTTILSKLHLD